MQFDPYEVLGVASDARVDEVRHAYLDQARRLHPDLNPRRDTADQEFKRLQSAYEYVMRRMAVTQKCSTGSSSRSLRVIDPAPRDFEHGIPFPWQLSRRPRWAITGWGFAAGALVAAAAVGSWIQHDWQRRASIVIGDVSTVETAARHASSVRAPLEARLRPGDRRSPAIAAEEEPSGPTAPSNALSAAPQDAGRAKPGHRRRPREPGIRQPNRWVVDGGDLAKLPGSFDFKPPVTSAPPLESPSQNWPASTPRRQPTSWLLSLSEHAGGTGWSPPKLACPRLGSRLPADLSTNAGRPPSAVPNPYTISPARPWSPPAAPGEIPRPAWLMDDGFGGPVARETVVGELVPISFQAVGFLAPYVGTGD